MVPNHPQPNTETALNAWRQTVAQAKAKPWLADLLARQGSRVFHRFVYFYHRLGARPSQWRRWQRLLGVGLAGAALLLALSGNPIAAKPNATIVVDGAVCTLADAITAANTDTATGGCQAGSGADVIDLQADVNLTSALPGFASAITLNGNDHTIQRTGGEPFPVLKAVVAASDLTLNNATISGGSLGIENAWGKTTLNNVTLTGNSGLAIYNVQATMTLSNSTITGNTAGAIFNYYGTMTVINSTVAGNGGGISNRGMGRATLVVQNSTISGNGANADSVGLNNDYGMAVVSNSIIAQQAAGKDCGGGVEIISDGNNLESGLTCGFTLPTDRQNVTAEQLKLGPLAGNGGPTKTMALNPGSVAIDHIANGTGGCGSSVITDQRGRPRPADGNDDDVAACDVGAYEVQPQPILSEKLWMPLVKK